MTDKLDFDAIEYVAKSIYALKPYHTFGQHMMDPKNGLPKYQVSVGYDWHWYDFERPAQTTLTSGETISRTRLRCNKKYYFEKYRSECRRIAEISIRAMNEYKASKLSNQGD